MPSSGKDLDLTSLASDASLLGEKDAGTASGPKSKKRSILSRLSGSRRGASSTSKPTTPPTAASSSLRTEGKKDAGRRRGRPLPGLPYPGYQHTPHVSSQFWRWIGQSRVKRWIRSLLPRARRWFHGFPSMFLMAGLEIQRMVSRLSDLRGFSYRICLLRKTYETSFEWY